jgi:hypothetical protein
MQRQRGEEEMIGMEGVTIENVKDEIFDMVKPKDPLFITVDDLLRSRRPETVIKILIDVQGFADYEHRESNPPPLPEDLASIAEQDAAAESTEFTVQHQR